MFFSRIGTRALTLLAAAVPLLQPCFGQIGAGSGWFLQGHVLLDDGTVPAEKVSIESVCGGIARTETIADKKGQFSFTLGKNNAEVMQDAARSSSNARGAQVPTAMNGNTVADCTVRAVLPGYRSDVVSLANLKFGDNPEIGTLALHKLVTAAGPAVAATTLAAPADARKAFDKGVEASRNRKWDDAAKSFQKAVEIYPQFAEAWYDLGKAQVAQNQAEAARTSFQRAAKADESYLPPYLEIANLDARTQDWKSLADVTAHVLKLAPASYPQAYLFHAVASLNLGDADAAERSAREGQKVDAQHQSPKLWQVLGMALASRGEFGPAAEQLKLYLEYAPAAPDAAAVRAQIADCESRAASKK